MKASIMTAATFSLLTMGSNATIILIDHFDEDQSVSRSPVGTSAPSTIVAGSAIGGFRTITVDVTADGGISQFTDATSNSAGDFFALSNGFGQTGGATLAYSFADTDVTSAGNNTSVRFISLGQDANFTFDISIFDADTGSTANRVVSIADSVAPGTVFNIPFADFSVTAGANTVDGILADADGVSIKFSTTTSAGDAGFDLIEFAPIPEPSRAMLAMAGLMAGASLRRRRR